jgi:tetratricopeptide (TPR) repeat protein
MTKKSRLDIACTGILALYMLLSASIALAPAQQNQAPTALKEAYCYLKFRNDSQALTCYENILKQDPGNTEALWGKAEILRRYHRYSEAEVLFNNILQKNSCHYGSLLGLASIDFIRGNYQKAIRSAHQILSAKNLDPENKALSYLLLGASNSKLCSQGKILAKFKYGTQIKGYFLKAVDTAGDLPDTHAALGTFYLLAPGIAGGNLPKAQEELTVALKLAPEFATAHARMAQYYKKTGNQKQYDYYLARAQELDPGNEVLKELQNEKSRN